MNRQEFIRFIYTRSFPLSIRQKLESQITPTLPPAFIAQKVLFIHIPKTGGKSIGNVIGTKRANHSSYIEYKKIFGPDEMAEFFIFSLVRNPLDRLISTWKYLHTGGNKSKEDAKARKEIIQPYNDINHFIMDRLESIAKENLFFRPQVSFLKDEEGRLAKDITIIHLENLEKEKYLLPQSIRNKKIPHLNKTDSGSFSFTEKSIKRIKSVYEEDYINFNYSK